MSLTSDSPQLPADKSFSANTRTAEFLMRGAGMMYSATVYSLAVRLLTTFIIAKALGPTALGVYSLCFATVQVLSMLSVFGQDTGLVRFVSLAAKQNDVGLMRGLLLSALRTGLVLAIVTAAGMWVVMPNVLSADEGALAFSVVPFFALAIAPQVVVALLSSFGLALGRRTAKALPDRVVGVTVQLVVSLVALWLGWGLWGISLAFLLNAVTGVVGVVILTRDLYPRHVPHEALAPLTRKLLGFSWKLGLSNVLGYLLLNAALFVLGVTDAAQAGIYAAASRLTLPGLLFFDAIVSVFAPHAASRLGEESLAHDLQRVTNWMIVASAPIFILLFAFAGTWMSLLGPEFASGGNVLAVMACAQMINILTGASSTIISVSNRPGLKIVNTVLAWGTNLVLVLLLTPQWGALGAAVSYFVAVVVIDTLEYCESRFLMGLSPWGRLMAKPGIIIAVSAVVVTLFSLRFAPVLWQVFGASALFLGGYAFLMWRFGLPKDDVAALRSLARSLPFLRPRRAV